MPQRLLAVGLALVCLGTLSRSPVVAQTAGRTAVRVLYNFENVNDVADLSRLADNTQLTRVADIGVTNGQNCVRLEMQAGAEYAVLQLAERSLADWSDFDYLALDLTTDDAHAYPFVVELWDANSKNYATRCTFENVTTHKGRQTLLYPINRARRNAKEGRAWDELEPQDKIDLQRLSKVKLFVTPLKDRAAVFWVDNIRLLQEDAAKPKLAIPLPAGAIAYDFGSPGATVPGFQAVAADMKYTEERGYGFAATEGLQHGGEGWPDLLTGTFVSGGDGGQVQFRAEVPNGKYAVWLNAGRIIRPDLKTRRYRLQLNETIVYDESPTPEEYLGTDYLYRFLWTPYSEKPHALFRNYISKMYPATTHTVDVTNERFTLTAVNHFLGGVILVPLAAKSEFDKFTAQLETIRLQAFGRTLPPFEPARPRKPAGDGDYALFLPATGRKILPGTAPEPEERRWTRLAAAGAPGQRIVCRIAVTPWKDLGPCTLELFDLTGPAGSIPAAAIDGRFQNYRFDGRTLSEMVLLPSLAPHIEAGVTQCFWLWIALPESAAAGVYRGEFAFVPENGKRTPIPVEVEVYPFQLAADLPGAYGMYYQRPQHPEPPRSAERRVVKEQFEFMRRVGFTSVSVGGPTVTDLRGTRQVGMKFDPTLFQLARETGLARRPEQKLMASALGIGRAIGRRLPGSLGAKVDQNPGIELQQPEFEALFLDALKQYAAFLDKQGLPVAIEVVDEPRETPNPWNRNLADAIRYADLLHEVPGLTTFITPMSDANGGRDYTVLVDHVDIVSVHAWKASSGLIQRTREKKKTLWLYNTGMDRLSWGFYNWKVGSAGRWEWHYSWPEDQAVGGYPGREWYNPFTSMHALAPAAPLDFPGAQLHQSAFLDVAEGLNDARYLLTLEQAVAVHKQAVTQTQELLKAEVLLKEIRTTIPDFPQLHGLDSADAGALVGGGLADPAAARVERWRSEIAKLLKTLRK